jgi:Flp pilus assembly protein TadB
MATQPDPGGRSSARQLAAAATLLAGVVTFVLSFTVFAVVIAALGGVGPGELVLVVIAAALVTWFVVRRLRAA